MIKQEASTDPANAPADSRTGVGARWWNLLAAAGGLLFIVLLQVGHEAVGGGGEMPALDAPVREYTAYISDTFGTTSYYVGQVIGWIGFGFLLLFMAALSRTLRGGEGEAPDLSTLALGGGVVAVLFMLAAGAPQFAVAIRFDEGLDPVTAATLFNAGNVFFMLAWLPLGISVGAFGAQILRTRALSRWLGVFTCVVAAALLGFPAALPSDAGYMGFGLFLLWTIVASIVLVVREVRHRALLRGPMQRKRGKGLRAIPLSAVAATTLALMTGCGGDDSGEALSKSEYVTRSNAICQKTSKNAGEQYRRIVGEGSPTPAKVPRFQRFLAKAVVPNIRENLDERRKLPAPAGNEQEIEAIVSAGEDAISGFELVAADRSRAEALWRGKTPDPARQFDALSKSYGIDKCAGEE